jgi:hypothetical protein
MQLEKRLGLSKGVAADRRARKRAFAATVAANVMLATAQSLERKQLRDLQDEWNSRVHSVVSTLDGGDGFSVNGELIGIQVVETEDTEFPPEHPEWGPADKSVYLNAEEKARVARARRNARLPGAGVMRTAIRLAHEEQAPHAVGWYENPRDYGTGVEDGVLTDDDGLDWSPGGVVGNRMSGLDYAGFLGPARRALGTGPLRWEHEEKIAEAYERREELATRVTGRQATDKRNADEWALANTRWDLFVDIVGDIRETPREQLESLWRSIKAVYRDAAFAEYFGECELMRVGTNSNGTARMALYQWDAERSAYIGVRREGDRLVKVVLSPTSPRLRLTGRQVAALEALAIDKCYSKCLGCEAARKRGEHECYRHDALREQRRIYAERLAEAREANTRRAGIRREQLLLYGDSNSDDC